MGFVRSLLNRFEGALPLRLRKWRDQIDFVRAQYLRKLQREPNLFRPSRFSEKMQWRKLFEASPLYTQLSDKIAMREFVTSKGFSSLLIPQLWIGDNPSSVPIDDIARPFVLKSSHASRHVIMIWPDQVVEREQITRTTSQWLNYCHGSALVEPGYLDVPRRLLIEPLLQRADGSPPSELKVFVFHGVARYVQYLRISRDRHHTSRYFSRDWEQMLWRGKDYGPPKGCPEKPVLFDHALTVAEKLCDDIDHCRVDFYLNDEQLYIGEMTLYAFNGTMVLEPDDADIVMGSHWKIRWPATRAVLTIMFRHWGSKRFALSEQTRLALPADYKPGPLHGKVARCDGKQVRGWAQDLAYPDIPVRLEVLIDGMVVGSVHADRMRRDLMEAGIGNGRHGFCLILPEPLSPAVAHTLTVRRVADGAVLGGARRVETHGKAA